MHDDAAGTSDIFDGLDSWQLSWTVAGTIKRKLAAICGQALSVAETVNESALASAHRKAVDAATALLAQNRVAASSAERVETLEAMIMEALVERGAQAGRLPSLVIGDGAGAVRLTAGSRGLIVRALRSGLEKNEAVRLTWPEASTLEHVCAEFAHYGEAAGIVRDQDWKGDRRIVLDFYRPASSDTVLFIGTQLRSPERDDVFGVEIGRRHAGVLHRFIAHNRAHNSAPRMHEAGHRDESAWP